MNGKFPFTKFQILLNCLFFRALGDIRESIAELKYYRQTVFKWHITLCFSWVSSIFSIVQCAYHYKLCIWSLPQSLLCPQSDFNLAQNKSLGISISHFPFINSSTASLPISSLDFAAYPLPAMAIPSWLWILSIYGLLLGATSTTQLSPW